MKTGDEGQCETCYHYPWSSKIFEKTEERQGYTRGEPVDECACKCHDAQFEKKKIHFTIEKSNQPVLSRRQVVAVSVKNYSGETIREGKIITKKQWEQFKKKNSWTGKWENYKKVLDESLAPEEAKKQGIVGYRDEGDYEAGLTAVDGSRLDNSGRSLYYVEAVKLVVCPICKKSEFDDTIFENINRDRVKPTRYESHPHCIVEHEHDMAECACGRRVCKTSFRNYFGFEFPETRHNTYDHNSIQQDWIEIEKIWGLNGFSYKRPPKISQEIKDKYLRESGGYGWFDPTYYINFLDVFRLMLKDDDTLDGKKVKRRDYRSTDDRKEWHTN
jgi:hypothetical protein